MRWCVIKTSLHFFLFCVVEIFPCFIMLHIWQHFKMYFTQQRSICDILIYHVICFDANWKIIKLVQISLILHNPPVKIWWFSSCTSVFHIIIMIYLEWILTHFTCMVKNITGTVLWQVYRQYKIWIPEC